MERRGYGSTDSASYSVQAGHENAWSGQQIRENGGSSHSSGADDHHREIQSQGYNAAQFLPEIRPSCELFLISKTHDGQIFKCLWAGFSLCSVIANLVEQLYKCERENERRTTRLS